MFTLSLLVGCATHRDVTPTAPACPALAVDDEPVEVNAFTSRAWEGIVEARLAFCAKDLWGTYSSQGAQSGGICLMLLPLGAYSESYSSCTGHQRCVHGTWELNGRGIVLHPAVADHAKSESGRRMSILTTSEGRLGLVDEGSVSSFGITGGASVTGLWRIERSTSYWPRIFGAEGRR